MPALFHTGHTGIGSGLPGGGGIRLKYSNPMDVDDVAVDFPELTIMLAHPSFPWQDEAISVALAQAAGLHRPVGLVAEVLPGAARALRQHAARDKVLFGSDFPMITPDRWLADFEQARLQGRGAAADPEGERDPPARPR